MELSIQQCVLLFIAAAGIGISKSGFAGISMLHVLIFAFVFGTKASTGVLLPMLVVGDVCAIWFFGSTAQWDQIRKLLPPALIGVVLGCMLMHDLDEAVFRPLVGIIIFVLTGIQLFRIWKPHKFEEFPHNRLFAWSLGLLAGVTTMLANAAGPVVALYLLAVALPKLELVGTSAWFFLVVNIFKLPLSYFYLDLISFDTLWVDLVFAPGILVGMFFGRWLLNVISQKAFNLFLLAFTAVASLRLVFGDNTPPAMAPPSSGPRSTQNGEPSQRS